MTNEGEHFDLFDPDSIYKDLQGEFYELLALKAADLTEDTAEKFKLAIYKQCERAYASQNVTVPAFGEGDWLNTYKSLDFNYDFKNRIFVIDFFTYCCINCIHILPYLKEVEIEHKNNKYFAVIGIHSPKFSHEKHFNSLEEAVKKYEISHPVLHDPDCKIWKHYGVFCWPTVFIVGFGHSLLFTLVGEAQIDKLPFLCEHILAYSSLWYLDYPVHELPVLSIDDVCRADEKASRGQTSLLFPGSVSTDGKSLAVSDTGHNRILLMSEDFKIQETVGSGVKGNKNGDFNIAAFNSPNGSTWFNGKLYVADTGNHSIREVDFSFKIVLTIFSNNEAEKFLSPWDVCIGPILGTDLTQLSVLYIAAAGSHQIWAVNLDPTSAMVCVPFAGSGKEENRGNSYRMNAGFAQPSGIAYSSLSPDHIYVADSESSTIKSIDLKNNGAVSIIVGGSIDPFNLFKFGDKDGKLYDCQLQHPMGVTVLEKNLLAITDSYNHKVKIIDAKKKECHTLDQPFNLQEPTGLCFIDAQFSNIPSEKKIFISDTNNHRIVPIQIYDFNLTNEQCDAQGPLPVIESFNTDSMLDELMTQISIDYDGIINCRFKWNLGDYGKINASGSNCSFEHQGDGLFKVEFLYPGGAFEGYSGIDPTLRLTSNKEHLEQMSSTNLKSSVKISCHGSYCDEMLGVCRVFHATFQFVIKFSRSGSKVVELFLQRYT